MDNERLITGIVKKLLFPPPHIYVRERGRSIGDLENFKKVGLHAAFDFNKYRRECALPACAK